MKRLYLLFSLMYKVLVLLDNLLVSVDSTETFVSNSFHFYCATSPFIQTFKKHTTETRGSWINRTKERCRAQAAADVDVALAEFQAPGSRAAVLRRSSLDDPDRGWSAAATCDKLASDPLKQRRRRWMCLGVRVNNWCEANTSISQHF